MNLVRLIDSVRFTHTLRCAVCALEAGTPLCSGCAHDYFLPNRPRCRCCALPLPSDALDLCGACVRQHPSFDATLVCADYVAPVSSMILGLKGGGRLSLAHVFGQLLAQRLLTHGARDVDGPCPWIIPVPLAPQRQRARGFNQSTEIARAMVHSLRQQHVDVGRVRTDLLRRTRHAPPQHSLDLRARRRNLRGAFDVCAPFTGQSVWVVDDVMTTGSTLEEIAKTLKRAGCARVTNLVVARTP